MVELSLILGLAHYGFELSWAHGGVELRMELDFGWSWTLERIGLGMGVDI